jgi:hypothetical protein
MQIIEINRMIDIWRNDDKRESDWIAKGLEFIIGSVDKMAEDENTATFRKNMEKLYPDPIHRAKVLKHMAVSMINEDPDDFEDGEKVKEAVFFLDEMLKSITQFDEISPDDYRMAITKLI